MDGSKVSGRISSNSNGNTSSTTVNGVVINIAAGGQHQVNNNNISSNSSGSSNSSSGSSAAKPSRKVRRDASFRLPAFLGGSKRSVNGSSSPGSSRRAPSPSSLSSTSSSSSPAFVPINNNNNNAKSGNLEVHSRPESARTHLKHHGVDFSHASSSSDLIANTVNLKVASDPMNETYKSLGDPFGINAAVESIAVSAGTVRSVSKNSTSQQQQQQHLKPSRSVSNVLSHHDPTYQAARLSTYANVPPANRFGSSDSRASYNERLSVSRQPSQPPAAQMQPHRQYSTSNGGTNSYSGMSNGTPRRPTGMMGPPQPPMTRSVIYKSNSSLDLDHDEVVVSPAQPDYQQLRREYGSQGSINFSGNRFAAAPPINPGYRERIYSGPVVEIGPTSPGPAAVSTLQRKSVSGHSTMNSTFLAAREMNKSEDSTLGSVISNGSSRGDVMHQTDTGSEASPKVSKKKLAGVASSGFFSKDRESNKSQKSLFKKLRGSKESNPDPGALSFTKEGDGTLDRQALLDDCHRRRFFLHHDVGSMCARMAGVANQIKMLERRNTTTGASAASAALRNGSGSESPENKDDGDHGDGVSNELVLR